ncbi:uncharacterized protein LOC113494068 [Trichoplusia ni]|uniref:Uncharacterized protein LOC113494068 n=1 Tax=Trichoplusia ni TaxID=7111 RepID=A0A7E5VII5_TRINI|nr:uncharacterized protein LOC113494068 [Trichoplusia ni]
MELFKSQLYIFAILLIFAYFVNAPDVPPESSDTSETSDPPDPTDPSDSTTGSTGTTSAKKVTKPTGSYTIIFKKLIRYKNNIEDFYKNTVQSRIDDVIPKIRTFIHDVTADLKRFHFRRPQATSAPRIRQTYDMPTQLPDESTS